MTVGNVQQISHINLADAMSAFVGTSRRLRWPLLGAKLPPSKLDRQMLLVLIDGHPPVGTSYVAFGEDERVLCGGVNCH